jgi:hypothetical protein
VFEVLSFRVQQQVALAGVVLGYLQLVRSPLASAVLLLLWPEGWVGTAPSHSVAAEVGQLCSRRHEGFMLCVVLAH